MRYARKVDANQSDIVEALRAIPECSVLLLSSVGDGCPDLLIGYRGANLLVELKNPETLRGEKPETIARQQEFRDGWRGAVIRAMGGPDDGTQSANMARDRENCSRVSTDVGAWLPGHLDQAAAQDIVGVS